MSRPGSRVPLQEKRWEGLEKGVSDADLPLGEGPRHPRLSTWEHDCR